MIFVVREQIDGDVEVFLFDSEKVDPSSPFEAAYLDLLKTASSSPRKDVSTLMHGALDARCGSYQNGATAWENLKAKMPCMVSESVTVWIG